MLPVLAAASLILAACGGDVNEAATETTEETRCGGDGSRGVEDDRHEEPPRK